MNGVREIRVGLATCGVAAGAQRVYEALVDAAACAGVSPSIKRVGCVGMCYNEPLVEVVDPAGNRAWTNPLMV